MDARQSTFENPKFIRPLVVRIVEAWLVLVLAIGLWQGYGEWFFNSRGGDVF